MTVAGTVVDHVLMRARDAHATAQTRAEVLAVLTACQRLLNAKYGLVVVSIPFATTPYRCVYPIADLLAPGALRVVGVWDGVRDLDESDRSQLWWLGGSWLRRIGPAPVLYAMLGRDMLVLWPAQTEAREVTVRAAVRTATLFEDTALEIPDDYVPLLTDLTLAVTIAQMRMFSAATPLMESIKARMTP